MTADTSGVYARRPAGPDSRVQALSTLLQLQQQARHAESVTDLGYIAVNETHNLLDYHQAVLWRSSITGAAVIRAASNIARVDRNAPYTMWLTQVLKDLAKHPNAREVHAVDPNSLDARHRDGWQEWSPGQALWCPLLSPGGELFGGLWLTRDTPWSAPECALLQSLADAYAHAWLALEQPDDNWLTRVRRTGVRRRGLILLGILAAVVLVVPVNETVLAPAEVIARDPIIVSAPAEGVVKQFYVRPNEPVIAGKLLFSLDDTAIRSRNEVAAKSLAVAQADYLRAAQKAFSDDASKAELTLLQAQVEERSAELEYTARLLERIRVRAEGDGIAVFTDPNDWLGKPVVTGEKVITLADPDHTELRAWVPVDDAINLEPGARVRVFLDTDPIQPLDAALYQTAYEAQVTPEDVLAFPVKAHFTGTGSSPRIGLTGTAKLYGAEVSLGYYLLRRPIAAVRQFLGL